MITLIPSAPSTAAPAAPPQPTQQPQPAAPAPADTVSIGNKIASLPRTVIEGAAGLVGGCAGVVYHAIPGAVEGVAEGLTSDRGSGGTGWYTMTMLTEWTGTGAAIGAGMGGPAGALVGAGAGFVFGVLHRAIEGKADVPETFVKRVEDAVDQTISTNTQGSKIQIAVQNATEGTIVGLGVGVTEGWKVGKVTGATAVGVVIDVAAGIAEGIWNSIHGPHKKP